jgi:hypothetical protein
MKFGSKGLDAPTIIGIIVALIIAIVIIYILWTRGMLPFAPAADRNLCLSEILDACAGTKPLKDVNDACTGFSDIAGATGTAGQQACWTCILGKATGTECDYGESLFQSCCEHVRSLPA